MCIKFTLQKTNTNQNKFKKNSEVLASGNDQRGRSRDAVEAPQDAADDDGVARSRRAHVLGDAALAPDEGHEVSASRRLVGAAGRHVDHAVAHVEQRGASSPTSGVSPPTDADRSFVSPPPTDGDRSRLVSVAKRPCGSYTSSRTPSSFMLVAYGCCCFL